MKDMKGCAPRLTLKKGYKTTWKWPIQACLGEGLIEGVGELQI